MNQPLTLSADQQAAYDTFARFVVRPAAGVLVLEGYAGTGKSTLVERMLDNLPKLLSTRQLIAGATAPNPEVILTATTNKACEALSDITGEHVRTIHSVLGLRVAKDYKTMETELVVRPGVDQIRDSIIFIDEASFIDRKLLQLIFAQTENCKIIFVGDPAQIAPVKHSETPVFNAGFDTIKLTEVMRQAKGNQIIELATAFRDTVNTGGWNSFTPNGVQIQHLDRETFEQTIIDEFTRDNWRHNDSKVLAWTNKRVIAYNHAIRNLVEGIPELQVGDYAVCNRYINTKQCNIRTDQLVKITHMETGFTQLGVPGSWVTLDYQNRAFLPQDLESVKTRLAQAKREEMLGDIREITEEWIDLRAAYACTINKSQGSTYDKVFIDLDDIKRCNSGNQIARMMYVAVSRARHTVYLVGDLV